jgi:arylsulfate sulfotransferase
MVNEYLFFKRFPRRGVLLLYEYETSVMTIRCYFYALAALTLVHAPVYATITIQTMTPSKPSPEQLGTPVDWVVTATDTNPGPLTFQFNVTSPSGVSSMVVDFNVGTYSGGVWTSQTFPWVTIAGEGNYQVQVVAKDFGSGETQSQTVSYQLRPRVKGRQAAVNTVANPLVALFSAPGCPVGSTMYVTFQQSGSGTVNSTDTKQCLGNTSMNFFVGGMYPSTTYSMNYVVQNGSHSQQGTALSFTTGSLPSKLTFPSYTVKVPPGSQADFVQPMMVQSSTPGPVATDLSGQIMWFYRTNGTTVLTRPLNDETMLIIQTGQAWTTFTTDAQLIEEIDLAGNIVHQSNTGVLQQELLALGAVDAGPCNAAPSAPLIGEACLGNFSHEVMRLPNGYTAVLATLEKIFPPGTQGSTSPLPIDIRGNIIAILDTNWQAVWYWDSFNPANNPVNPLGPGYGYPNLSVSRAATLGETCISMENHCGPVFLVGPGTAPAANEWLHGNSIYYIPSEGDLLLSLRNQDWLLKIDYVNGTGTGNVLWRMGNEGDFQFQNINNDPWPWFSGQHDAGYENNGAGPLTVFDDGNTRRATPPIGLGSGCEPYYCGSRGMALTVNENNMTVMPVLSQYLGEIAEAYGSAQLLSNGNYYFDSGLVSNADAYCQEVLPTPGTINGNTIYNIEGPSLYRSFRMSNLYNPPIT